VAGLDVCEQFMDVNDVIKDEDLVVHRPESQRNGLDHRFYKHPSVHNIQQLVASMVPSVISKRPSARELNLLKRKAKINSKDQVKSWSEDGDTEVACPQSTTPKGSNTDSFSFKKVPQYLLLPLVTAYVQLFLNVQTLRSKLCAPLCMFPSCI
jgi:TATA-binding protein-associated factor